MKNATLVCRMIRCKIESKLPKAFRALHHTGELTFALLAFNNDGKNSGVMELISQPKPLFM